MKITGVRYRKINVPFEAPMLWSGGVNRSWRRIVVRMQTDEAVEGIAETSGDDAKLRKLERLNESEGDLVFYGHEDRREPRYMGIW